jgi:hypothetical protein
MKINDLSFTPPPMSARSGERAREQAPVDSFTPGDWARAAAKTIEPSDLRSAKAVARDKPVEGTQRSFWRWDFSVMPPGFKKIDSTCRAHLYIIRKIDRCHEPIIT